MMMKNKLKQSLAAFEIGHLTITTPCGEQIELGQKNKELHANMHINNWLVIEWSLLKGSSGLGKAYMHGFFSTDNLQNLLLLLVMNERHFQRIYYGNYLYRLFWNIKQIFNRNNLLRSQKNIQYHYDVGNKFYSLWLDDSMSYSSGIYDNTNNLKRSQEIKYLRILSELQTIENAKILEIGSGWGAFISQSI